MKKCLFLPLMLLCLLFSACSPAKEESSHVVKIGTTIFTVDPQTGSISDGANLYRYTSSGNTVEFTYPDGSTYWCRYHNSSGVASFRSGSYSDDYDPSRYVDGMTLCDVLEKNAPKERPEKNVFLILILMAVGLFNTISPRSSWYLGYGWRFKDAEPSEAALLFTRAGGILLLIIAAFILIS